MKNLNQYETQAKAFLEKYGITLTIRATDSGKCPPFCDGKHIHGDEYTVRLVRPLTQKTITFPFWNSQHDSQNGIRPNAYDVLACISSDLTCPQTFEEFCGEYGYDTDSRIAHSTFRRCKTFAAKLNYFFDSLEMETDLQAINCL